MKLDTTSSKAKGPVPLEVLEPYTDRQVFPIAYKGDDGAYRILGEINSAGGSADECKSNAVAIVGACNLHDKLVDALKAVRDLAKYQGSFTPDIIKICSTAINQADDLVARMNPREGTR